MQIRNNLVRRLTPIIFVSLGTLPLSAQSSSDSVNREKQITTIFQLHRGRAMDSVFRAVSNRFREANADISNRYDDVRCYIAMQYATENNVKDAERYILSLKDSSGLCNRYFRLASTFEKGNDLAMAIKYASLSTDTAISYLRKDPEGAPELIASTLAASARLSAILFEKEQRYTEAIDCLSRSISFCSSKNQVGLLIQKGDLLLKARKYEDAMELYSQLIKARVGGPLIETKLKEAYMGIHGGDEAGFTSFITMQKAKWQQAYSDSIRHSTFRQKAPAFTLKDIDGNTISLNDYVGKVVVLDFWATWCVPCKASFPAMQAALEKYQPNPNVVFLFVDTWEQDKSPEQTIRTYLQRNNYGFKVVLDKENPETKKCEVVSNYKITGVPTKIIIDKAGYMRFKLTGFNGSKEQAVEELSEMIDLLL